MQSMADVVRYVPGVQMAQGEGHRDAPVLRGNTSTAEQLASLTATNRTPEPEEFTNTEIGVKRDLNARISTTVAVYQLDRTNVAITDPNDPTQLLLVDGQTVDGVELGLTGQLSDRWQLIHEFVQTIRF